MQNDFKSQEELRGIGSQVMHLSNYIQTTNLQLKDLNTAIRNGSASANKSTFAMLLLTGALVLFTFAQVYIAWKSHAADQKIIEIKKDCYQTVLQTDNIDLNFKNCLRSAGLSE